MLSSPYLQDGFTWMRGNLHTHTTASDGDSSAADTIARFAAAGHDFVAITDHDVHFDAPAYEGAPGVVLLSGVEVSAAGPHVLAVNTSGPVAPDADRQKCIDAAGALGGLTVLNHPNWQTHFSHWPQEAMESLERYTGIEIYNGVVEFLEGSALALDRWDRLLSGGKRVWGFANDDLHVAHQPLLGSNVVQVTERTAAGVVEGLRSGRFYATTGVTIESVVSEGDTLRVETRDADVIRFVTEWGREVWRAPGPAAELPADAKFDRYVRAECYGAGMACAWTQPLWATVPPPGGPGQQGEADARR